MNILCNEGDLWEKSVNEGELVQNEGASSSPLMEEH